MSQNGFFALLQLHVQQKEIFDTKSLKLELSMSLSRIVQVKSTTARKFITRATQKQNKAKRTIEEPSLFLHTYFFKCARVLQVGHG